MSEPGTMSYHLKPDLDVIFNRLGIENPDSATTIKGGADTMLCPAFAWAPALARIAPCLLFSEAEVCSR